MEGPFVDGLPALREVVAQVMVGKDHVEITFRIEGLKDEPDERSFDEVIKVQARFAPSGGGKGLVTTDAAHRKIGQMRP